MSALPTSTPNGLTSFRGDPAGIVSRALAFVVDAVVISLASSITAYAIASVLSLFDVTSTRQPLGAAGAIAFSALVGIIAFTYFTAAFWLFGRTAGKLVFGLRVVRADGGRPRLAQSMIRTLAYAVSAILMLGFIAIGLSRQRRGWHDRIARTWVVYDWDAHPRLAAVDDGEALSPHRLP